MLGSCEASALPCPASLTGDFSDCSEASASAMLSILRRQLLRLQGIVSKTRICAATLLYKSCGSFAQDLAATAAADTAAITTAGHVLIV